MPSHRSRARLLVAVGLVALSALTLPALALAASPAATSGADVGDPRSSGQGPGLVGDPVWAIVIVVLIAGLSLAATLVYVRMTATKGPSQRR
jgi:hypothetical protein